MDRPLTISRTGLVSKAAAFVFSVILVLSSALSASGPRPIGHEITADIHPEKHSLTVEDRITFPEEYLARNKRAVRFLINGALTVSSPTTGVKLAYRRVPRDNTPVPLMEYSLELPAGRNDFVLKYRGHINNPPGAGDSVRTGPSESAGFINEEGVQLEGISYWYPEFGDDLITFGLEVRMPEPWKAVSQGQRIMERHEPGGTARTRWVSPEPQDEIILIGGRFTEYARERDGVAAMAFLRKPDDALAASYIDTTFEYLDEYDRLIGPYPYKKFALVENIAETGFGLPSLTLLGPRVIRLPFMLVTSYPHEILHNWWGNGVYVDYARGNWSEGLTAYLADHLIKEQNGAGAEYRRDALQKYADYVTTEKDFPLTEFRSRHGSVTAAVGYGKTMMFFHMLRLELGDDAFIRALRDFYEKNKFRRASFSDVEAAFSAAAGRDFKPEFDQWINRPGAPVLRIRRARTVVDGNGFRLKATLDQTQKGGAYSLSVPVAVQMEGSAPPYQTVVRMDGKRLNLDLRLHARPWRLDVDPEYDVFRRLDRFEIPPALSQPFGADQILVILPSRAPKELLSAYRRLAEVLTGGGASNAAIRLDSEVKALPRKSHVWIFGWENRFLKSVRSAVSGYDASVSARKTRIQKTALDRKRHAVVLTARHPRNPALSLSWLASDNPAALAGLGRKLPHYGRYGYLAFDGDEPVNILKGDWPVTNSPMSAAVDQGGGKTVSETPRALKPRRALIYPAEMPAAETH